MDFDAGHDGLLVRPDPTDPRLTRRVAGLDHTGARVEASVTVERALTLYLNGQEIVTMMTIGDRPEDLALGYLLNQGMLRPGEDEVTAVEHDEDLGVVVVRTARPTDHEARLRKKTLTSGCAQGTAFGDLMEGFAEARLPRGELRTSWLYGLLRRIGTLPTLYLEAGAIHGCALCERDRPVVYMEDVGRHNAVDKIAGWMHRTGTSGEGRMFYTTGRLTSEMVIKCVRMGVPVLISRSGFTAWGVDLAREAGLTLVGRCKGRRFVALAGEANIVFDADPSAGDADGARGWRKNSREAEAASAEAASAEAVSADEG